MRQLNCSHVRLKILFGIVYYSFFLILCHTFDALKLLMMKKLLLTASIFFFAFFSTFSQSLLSDICDISPKSYKVCVKEKISSNIDIKHIIPRVLKKSEYCIIQENRDLKNEIIISLDEMHEVIIYPYNVP